MYRGKKIGVAIAAYNEEPFVAGVVASLPSYVDRVYVVDDASTDNTVKVLRQLREPRLTVARHRANRGVGAARVNAIRSALDEGMDIIATVDADGQMDTSILHQFLDPIVNGLADCTKGDRLSSPRDCRDMPRIRIFGTRLLNVLTRIASGYSNLADAQNGYMALSQQILRQIDLEALDNSGHSFENLLLIELHAARARLTNVRHAALYGGEKSSLRLFPFMVGTSILLVRGFLWRVGTEKRRTLTNK